DFDVNLDDIDEAGFDLNDGEEVMQEEDADAEIIIDETKDSEELKRLRAEGAQPMTPAPEDTSYLDEDPLTVGNENILDESSIDLSQAVIDEPDLSAGITENPLQEPSPDDISLGNEDISIDLDMEEDEKTLDLSPESGLPEEEEEIEFSIPEDEITLPASSEGEDNFAQVIPEGFVVEADESQVPFEDDDDMEGEVSFAEEEDVASLDAAPDTAGVTEAADVNAEVLSNDESLNIPSGIRGELKTVLSYMDQLLESLPEEKIEEFAKSEYFDTYKKLFKELGLV
ncbi:MAG: hypothetical protein LBS57_01565, partial [Treponema sp.]|nr:hypothetical protein [Treponema sp.]